ncbi:hypothetical protein KC721_00820 [Candidatus Woesebacteria bacterium]|nr:hypothetical protein [Candidatus Woesebacteria bacterium]
MKQKEQEELKALLDASDEEEPSDDGANGGEKPEVDKSNDKSKSDKKDESMEDKNKSKDKKKDAKNQDRWHGKSREEIIKEYEALEKNQKPEDDEIQEKDNKDGMDDNEELNLPSAEELQKMTPSDFAKWVLARIDEGVKRTIEVQEKVRTAVQKEIEEAKKDHPLHEPDYRKMVQTIIDAANAKGTTVSLKEACMQVDAFLGKHKVDESENNDEGESEELSDQEKSRLKKAKAQVESGAGAPTQPDSSDAETKRIQKALAGSGSKSPLGGLGI